MRSFDLSRTQWLIVLGGGIVVAIVGSVGLLAIGTAALAVSLGVAVAMILAILFELHGRTLREVHLAAQRSYHQTEALASLMAVLRPRAPLPEMRGWAAMPDLLKEIADVIWRERPQLIVEASSGVSTLVAAYCLERLGYGGRVISLESDATFAEVTRRNLALHGLSDWATVVDAPLRDVVIQGTTWRWYATDALADVGPIDLLVIDGPPSATGPLARYPALPILFDRLREGAVVLLDDGNRADESQIAQRWKQELRLRESRYLPFDKGAFLFRKGS